MDPNAREIMCITTVPPKIFLPNDTDYETSSNITWPPDACWSELINDTAEHNVIYVGENIACILNLPPDVRAWLIQWMTDKFEFSPINCHIQFKNDETANSVTGYIMLVLLFISMICLILTVVVYAVKKELLTVPGLNLACLCISHFLHYLIGSINLFNLPDTLAPRSACTFFGFMRHFSILATFFWLNVMAYDIWRTVARMEMANSRKVFDWKRFSKYSAYAWGMALFIAITAVIVDNIDSVPVRFKPLYRRPHVNDPDIRCTMKTINLEGFLLYNIIPRITVLVANIIFFILTASAIHNTSTKAETLRSTRRAKTRFRLYVKLFIVMGLAWILNAADFMIYAKMGPDWVHSGPKWFNVLASYVTTFIGIGIYITFGLIPTISLVRRCRGKTENRLSAQSTLNPSTATSVRLSNGNHTTSTKF